MTTAPLPAPSKCKSGLPRITGTCPEERKQSFRLRLWSLVWFRVRATSCHITSSKSAWKTTPKCIWMCWRVWWSPGAIRWPVADPGWGNRTRRRPKVQRDSGLASEGVVQLCTLLSLWCPRGVMIKAMNCGIVVREFVLQSRYYVHFRANTLGKGMNPFILPPAMDK